VLGRLAVPTQNTRQDLAEELDVSSLPTIGLFRNGAEIDRSIGSNIDGVVEMLAKAGAASSKASSSPRASL
jgi:thioredoxin-like negative regulator of GroEL